MREELRARFNAPLNAAQVAELDRWEAARNAVERAWPFNVQVMADHRGESVVLDRLAEPYAVEYMADDRSYLILPQGLVIEVEPTTESIDATARAHLPAAAGECDLCDREGIAYLAVVAVPRNLVGVQLCDVCAAEYDPDHLIPIPQPDKEF